MSGAAFLRVEKLKVGGIIALAARHNKRTIQAEIGAAGSIDPTRSHLNYGLAGPSTAEAVAQLANDLMTAADVVKLRKDAVRGIEAVFSLPVGTALDTRAYFTDCLAWAAAYFGGMANILSFDVHLDEAAPHAHALILPMVNGRMDGSAMVGARSKLLAMQSQFHDRVAKKYGLRKAFSKLMGEAKERAAAQVLAHLRETGDASLQSLAWPSIRGCIEADPAPFLLALGMVAEPAQKVAKPFAHYVTSKGKGPAKERDERNPKPIGFAQKGSTPKPIGFTEPGMGKEQSLCSGGFAHLSVFETPTPATNEVFDATEYHYLTECSDEHQDVQRIASPRHKSTSGNSSTPSLVGDALGVPPTECEFVAATHGDDGEDF